MNKGLTLKTGQTHVQHNTQKLLAMIVNGSVDPSFVVTHQMQLADAPKAYEKFRDKKDGCIKVILQP